MKALVFKGVGNIAWEQVKDPMIQDPTDAVVMLTRSAICGTDLHMIRGTLPTMIKGTILGHEGIGVVEKVGSEVHDFKVGDRVIIPSTIACGKCHFCTHEIYSQCDVANPRGPHAGTAFYGGPKESGPFNGMQAERVRVPFADVSLVAIPLDVLDDQVILLSDILPTAFMGVEMANINPEDAVAVFGCGPVGQLVIFCLKKLGVHKIFAIDKVVSRLKIAEKQGAYTINFDKKDPVKELKRLTYGQGPEKIIDAVGVDAEQPYCSFIDKIKNYTQRREFKREVRCVAPKTNPKNGNWIPGNGPSQVVQWAVKSVAKNGTISIVGVYGDMKSFPIGEAMGKNITLVMGDCNHRKYIPQLLQWVQQGEFDSRDFVTQTLPLSDIVKAYKHFDKRDDGWIKVVLKVNEVA